MKKGSTRSKGDAGERLAAEYLQRKGFKILERNYRYERGEIDLVAEDGDELVFVEVKMRRSRAFGEPEEAVNEGKQEQIRTTAEGYLFERQIEDKVCRFDVVGIVLSEGKPEIDHIRDAF